MDPCETFYAGFSKSMVLVSFLSPCDKTGLTERYILKAAISSTMDYHFCFKS